jgi:basic amino acid/polyamine antiporter, APA family
MTAQKSERQITLWEATLITLGAATVSAGTFVVIGSAVEKAGSGLILSILIAGIVAFATAAGGAQLGAAIPISGGGFIWARELGYPLLSFLSGAAFLLKGLVSQSVNALVLVMFAQLVVPQLPLHPLAAGFMIAVTILNYCGVKLTAELLAVLTAFTTLLLILYCIVVWPVVSGVNFHPILGHGIWGILGGAGSVFFAYSGFERAAVVASEIKDPKRTIPWSIFISYPISMALFVMVGVVTLGSLSASGAMDDDLAIPNAWKFATHERWTWVMPLAAVLASGISLGAGVFGDSQLAREMAIKHELPRWFAEVKGEKGTPRNAVLVLGLIMAALALYFNLRPLLKIVNAVILIWYGTVNFASTQLPQSKRLVWPSISWFGLCGCVLLLVTLPWWAIGVGGAVLAIGAIVRWKCD